MKEVGNNKSKKRRYLKEGISFKKSFLLLFILLLQFVLIIVIYVRFVNSFAWVYTISLVIAFLTSLRVLLHSKNPASKASWIIFILLFPSFGFFIYFLAGGSDIHPLHKRRLHYLDKKYNHLIESNVEENLPAGLIENVNYLSKTTGAALYKSGEATYFDSGEAVFSDILSALENAKKSIYLEFFIINHGTLLNEILNILYKKAEAGVDVRIIYDGFGSKDLMNRALRKSFKKSGIKAYSFEPIKPIFSMFMNYRDHRKMFIIDNSVAYIGGFNVSDEYANRVERFGYWKDTGLKLKGDAVNYYTLNFLKMWMFVTKKDLELTAFPNSRDDEQTDEENGAYVIPYVVGPYQDSSVARTFYMNLISRAEHKIDIMTPYLVIDDTFIELLKMKALSGVSVTVILPKIPDKFVVYQITKSIGLSLAEAGCYVYTLDKGFIHSKNILIDDKEAVIGSINFDYRSFYQQYENAAYLLGGEVIKNMAYDFAETVKKSSHIRNSTLEKLPVISRFWVAILKWISPLM